MNASSADIDWIIRRSTEMGDNPFTAIIGLFVAMYAIAGVVLLCAGIIGYFTHRKGR